MSAGVKATPLIWRSQSADSGRLHWRTAPGRFPGWTYELIKMLDGTWSAVFADQSGFTTAAHPGGQRVVLLDSGTFAQARAAAIAHHSHPGY